MGDDERARALSDMIMGSSCLFNDFFMMVDQIAVQHAMTNRKFFWIVKHLIGLEVTLNLTPDPMLDASFIDCMSTLIIFYCFGKIVLYHTFTTTAVTLAALDWCLKRERNMAWQLA